MGRLPGGAGDKEEGTGPGHTVSVSRSSTGEYSRRVPDAVVDTRHDMHGGRGGV